MEKDQEQSMIKSRLATILKRIQTVRQTSSIAHQVRLVAVSKTKTVEEIKEAYDAGIRHFGENYVDQIEQKQPKLPQDINWHFIGHLQSNKIKKIMVPNLFLLQTVDRESLAEKINKYLQKENRKQMIYLQVKTSDQDSKSGVQIKNLPSLYEYIVQKCPYLVFRGLMTIGKQGDEEAFKRMSELKAEMCQKYKIQSKDFDLSMGMSADFETAIKYGSTSVRVGSSIFGPRSYPKKAN